jgi:hypothetical protein
VKGYWDSAVPSATGRVLQTLSDSEFLAKDSDLRIWLLPSSCNPCKGKDIGPFYPMKVRGRCDWSTKHFNYFIFGKAPLAYGFSWQIVGDKAE